MPTLLVAEFRTSCLSWLALWRKWVLTTSCKLLVISIAGKAILSLFNTYLPNPIPLGVVLEPVDHAPSNCICSNKFLVLVTCQLTSKALSSRFIGIRTLNENHGLNRYEDL